MEEAPAPRPIRQVLAAEERTASSPALLGLSKFGKVKNFSAAPVPVRGGAGHSALHEAVLGGDAARVSELLAAGADPNAADGAGRTPLHWLCGYGGDEAPDTLLTLLAHRETRVDARDAEGFTPLMLAADRAREAVAEALLAAGAGALLSG